MALTPEDMEAALVEDVCARVRERLTDDETPQVEEFVRQYYHRVPTDDLGGRDPGDLYGAALAHWRCAERRKPGATKVRVYNPQLEQHGWQSTHTVIEIVSDDMPFLVDSVTMELTGRDYAVHLMIHPVVRLRRDDDGRLVDVIAGDGPEPDDMLVESMIHAEIDRQTQAAELEELRADLLRVVGEVRAVVEDWPTMRARAHEVVAELDERPPPVDPADLAETKALLQWLDDGHYTFLGFREYELVDDAGEDQLSAVPGTGLGILRERDLPLRRPPAERGFSRSFSALPSRLRAMAREPRLLYLNKGNSRATVHRRSYLDYVGVERFDAEGSVVGERRFFGLYSTAAYRGSVRDVPVVRRKIQDVVERADFPPGGHDEKALYEVLETFPRDELFQISRDELFHVAMGIVALAERPRVRLFVREDEFERFLSCLVFLPRDRFNTQNRERVQEILRTAFDGESVDFSLQLTEAVLVRIHLIVRTRSGEWPSYDVGELEERIYHATRAWGDDLKDALLEEAGEEQGTAWLRRYADAFPPGYRADRTARAAVADIERIEDLPRAGGLSLNLYRPLEAPSGALRCRLFLQSAMSLSDVLPMFEHMGLRVADEHPYEITPADGPATWIYDFGLESALEGEVDIDAVRDLFEEAFVRIARGEAENDGFNALVLGAGLSWRDVTVLRTIARYLRQAGTTFSDRYMERSLLAQPGVTRLLVALFHARLDPARGGDEQAAEAVAQEIEEAIDAVESLDQDRILRNFLAVVRATLRTNHFQAGPKPYLALKLDPRRIPAVPEPRPRFEIFVCSPRVEGVHLRGGSVARGGLRWSDRREDYRTEILGLMKAQMVKNALIVPVGAKGGFVVKRPPAGGREELGREVLACYRTFICGLLDITDNIADGDVVGPPDVVRHDGDDPYLVVAADKGTATFSDVANGIAAEYGFWLGDAFASGGSAGYDHKGMGITARGAWESVKRHFRELGHDIQAEDFTVAGIGDMSGDVFGNGMLLSEHIRLVAAFDHRDVFLDPDPDPRRGLTERRRLFGLERSSWQDYDTSLISEGGGVWPRTAKSIPLAPQVRQALGVDTERMTPHELMRAILRAPVDLLWNGGIGTYVKASGETHADVGDKANDAVRVDGAELRCRVVGEGGNLGFTQRGRIEYALAGGRINTDAIDNAAGVNCSDHEVNIKILLDSVVAEGDMTGKQRNALLADMTDAVAERVLRGNELQAQALSLARAQAPDMLDVHDRLIRHLEGTIRLDRRLEALPDAEAIGERRSARHGLTQPELAVLLAYSKITLYAALLASDLPEDPWLSGELERYFPAQLGERFPERMQAHRLRREIIATRVGNAVVDAAGSTFPFRLGEETGAPPADIARAFAIAREVFGMRGFWAAVEALDTRIAADTQVSMLLAARTLVERASRWLLRNRRPPLDIAANVERYAEGAHDLDGLLPAILAEGDRERWRARVDELVEAGVPERLAGEAAALPARFASLDVVEVADASGLAVVDVAPLHFLIGARLHLHWLRDRIAELPRDNRWKAMARAALRDDLFGLHAEMTRDVLRAPHPADLDAEALLHAWSDANAAALERCLGIISDIESGGVYDLTTLPVALREMRNLIRSSSPGRTQ